MDALNEQVDKGIQILKQGGVIAFPTDTVYGLGADAFNSNAVKRIYDIKKRPTHLPLPLLIGDIKQLDILAEPLSEIALFLARRFWPGGLTLVVPKVARLPGYLGNTSIAVRIPAHPVCLALIQAINNPLIGTSANISGRPSALTAGEVKQQLGSEVDLIIDGGRCPGGGESTVVDVTGGEVVILRQGIIPGKEIKRAVEESGALHPHPSTSSDEGNSPSPSLSRQGRGIIHPHPSTSSGEGNSPLPSPSRQGRGIAKNVLPGKYGGRELEGGGKEPCELL